MTSRRPHLAFVSPLFLFPTDAGGRIRTTNILRGLKGGAFELTLCLPAEPGQAGRWGPELAAVADHVHTWAAEAPAPRWARAGHLLSALPVNVRADRTRAGLEAVRRLAERSDIDIVVFDFVHSAVLKPAQAPWTTLCFTHNVESEIFARHATQARDPARRWLWGSQHRKMLRFERDALQSFDGVIAVSERDAQAFRKQYGLPVVDAIPTGVDLDFYAYRAPDAAPSPPTVVFLGAMDWQANIDGVTRFLREVWPLVLAKRPDAHFRIVGRRPSSALSALAASVPNVSLTGFVDDVRPHVQGSCAFVIPLDVGGGTRIKAFEAMAMGCPVVSTAIGIEGLDADPDRHFLLRDGSADMAAAVLSLIEQPALREQLARDARQLVEERFGHRAVAAVFERICLEQWHRCRAQQGG